MLGAVWSVLSHIPADPDPPYKVSVGDDHGNEPVAFYVAGDHYSVVLGVSYDFGPEDVAPLVFGSPSADPADVDPARLGAPGLRIRGASGGKWGESAVASAGEAAGRHRLAIAHRAMHHSPRGRPTCSVVVIWPSVGLTDDLRAVLVYTPS